MSDWIRKAIETAACNRSTEREYALLREATYRRLMPDLLARLREQITADISEYNAAFPNAPDKHIVAVSNSKFEIDFQKTESPTGRLMVTFSQDHRYISVSLTHTSATGDRTVTSTQSYNMRLDREVLVITDEAGTLVSIPELSQRVVEPFIIAVAAI